MISYNFINKPINQKKILFENKVIKIFIHGFLHLLGFDHSKLKDYKKMLKEEQKIYKSVIKKFIKLKKKIYFELLFLNILGALTSLSLPPNNFFIINFITFSYVFTFLYRKKKIMIVKIFSIWMDFWFRILSFKFILDFYFIDI